MNNAGIIHFESWELLALEDRRLLERALYNQSNAYAPYSRFRVGAAIRLSDGRIIDGFNIENAAYPLCICAERSAIAHAICSAPEERIATLAVVGGNTEEVPFPCGSCRQVMLEMAHRQGEDFKILIGASGGQVYVASGPSVLLPHSFRPDFLI